MSKNKCEICGATCEEEKCFRHKSKKPLPKINKKLKKEDDGLDRIVIRNTFFETIWNKRKHRCEVTGTILTPPILSTYFHHILPKSKYPELEYVEENIILLYPEIHDNVEIDMYRYEEINKRREQLKTKYNL